MIEFFRRFVWHLSAAAFVLFVVLLVGEYFVPGSVLPFVNLVDASMGVAALLILTVFVAPRLQKKKTASMVVGAEEVG